MPVARSWASSTQRLRATRPRHHAAERRGPCPCPGTGGCLDGVIDGFRLGPLRSQRPSSSVEGSGPWSAGRTQWDLGDRRQVTGEVRILVRAAAGSVQVGGGGVNVSVMTPSNTMSEHPSRVAGASRSNGSSSMSPRRSEPHRPSPRRGWRPRWRCRSGSESSPQLDQAATSGPLGHADEGVRQGEACRLRDVDCDQRRRGTGRLGSDLGGTAAANSSSLEVPLPNSSRNPAWSSDTHPEPRRGNRASVWVLPSVASAVAWATIEQPIADLVEERLVEDRAWSGSCG